MPGIRSLRFKVPTYLALGLAITLTAWTWVSYRNMLKVSRAVGVQHLDAVATQFAATYANGARDFGRTMRVLTNNSAVLGVLAGNSARDRDSAAKLLKRAAVNGNRRLEILSLDGRTLLAVADSGEPSAIERHAELDSVLVAAARGPDYAGLAPLRLIDGTVAIPMVTAIVADNHPVGFVVVWRRAGSSTNARNLITQLIGARAIPYLGNARGDVWTDFTAQPRRISTTVTFDTLMQYRRGDTTPVMATARRITGTPWAVLLEFDEAEVVAPAEEFLRRSILAGGILLALTLVFAWLLSRRTTVPLSQLNAAARALAGGDYQRRVNIDRHDEIGQLADSFNTMAQHVSDARDDLEAKVRERTATLQGRNEELEAFAHSVSHDLRAPLRAMHGFSQALLDDYADRLDDTGRDFVRRIVAASQRMDALTQDLLAYSRVSRQEVTLMPVELDQVVRDATAQLEADITTRKAKVTMHEPLPRVVAHRPMLEQTLANLISNGLKFVAPDRTPTLDIGAERSNGKVRIWVADNGIGIDPTHQQRIFSVFERLHGADQYPGTGIGLAIVRKAVERMGGVVGVDSKIGAGSRFWIELPSAEAPK